MFHLRRHNSAAFHSQTSQQRNRPRSSCQNEKLIMDTSVPSQARSQFLTLNISGAIFEIREERLGRCPDTLLGCEAKRGKYYDQERDQYFFDRHRQAFEGILFYYQSNGRLVRPENVPEAVFTEEVKFFELPAGQDGDESYLTDDTAPPGEEQVAWKRKLWELFEMPETSLSAKLLQIFSQAVLVLSIVGSCLSSVAALQIPPMKHESGRNVSDEETLRGIGTLAQDVWILNDIICHGWFTFECLIRFIVAPNKKDYLKLGCNLVDMATIFTFYWILVVRFVLRPSLPGAFILLRVLQTLSVILRILRLARYSTYMKILALTFATGLNDLGMLMLFVVMVVLLASSAVFYAETSEDIRNANFTSIPDTFWWSVVTITTIGYGDQVPATTSGKFVAGVCTVLGTLIIALPLFRFATQFRDRLEGLGIGYRSPDI